MPDSVLRSEQTVVTDACPEDIEKIITPLSEQSVMPDGSPKTLEQPFSDTNHEEELNMGDDFNENSVKEDKLSTRLDEVENSCENFANTDSDNNRQIPQKCSNSICESEEKTAISDVPFATDVDSALEMVGKNSSKDFPHEVGSINVVTAAIEPTEPSPDSDLSKSDSSKSERTVVETDSVSLDIEETVVETDSISPNIEETIAETDSCPPDTEEFELHIEESETAAPPAPPEKKMSAEERKIELRNQKLALLSRLNVPLRKNVGLNIMPGMVIELGESEPLKPGVLELQKKFADHTTIQKKDPKKEALKQRYIFFFE